MRLTTVHQLVEYEPGKPFSWFSEEVANARRDADKDPLKKQLGDFIKLKGNSFYGKMIEDLGGHKSTKLRSEERVIDKALGLRFLTICKRLVKSMRSKSLRELLWSKDLISVVLLCINWQSCEY